MIQNIQYRPMANLAALPGYNPMRQGTQQTPIPTLSGSTGAAASANYQTLAEAANAERQRLSNRANERQRAVIGGYDQQIMNSRALGDQGYSNLRTDYDAIAADANATRDRNMARVDQYGNSMRSDLAIKNQQALAAASQGAIKRGLGNMTISDSLRRGANFDGTRQQLALEDQLLQNRIATDMSLSGAYQNTLQNRATGLAAQWNQNVANENALTGQRLGYIGGIQENMDGFNTVADLYTQKFQMDNANEQSGLERTSRETQAGLDRQTTISQAELDRQFQGNQGQLERTSRESISNLDRTSRETQAERDRTFQDTQARLERESRVQQADIDRQFQERQTQIDQRFRSQQAELDRQFQGRESAAEREERHRQAELDRQWQQQESERQRAMQIQQAQLDREQQTREAEAQRKFEGPQRELDRIANNDPMYGRRNPLQPTRTVGAYRPAHAAQW